MEMLPIYFITSNNGKVKSMRKWVEPLDIKVYLRRPSVKQPERKEATLEEVAKFKILDHKDSINAPFVVQDGGFFLESHPGFPGPNVNHILSTIGVKGILQMIPQDHRECYFKDVLAFWSPALEKSDPKNPIRYFVSRLNGLVPLKPSENNSNSAWSDLWRIFIPDGFNCTLAEMGKKDHEKLSNSVEKNCFIAFAEWIKLYSHYLYRQAELFEDL